MTYVPSRRSHVCSPRSGDASRGDDQVVTLSSLREVFPGVIDDMVGASVRALSTFPVLHTAVTSAPNCLAIWMAKGADPPDAPSIRTFWPDGCLLVAKSLQRADGRHGHGRRSSNGTSAGFGASLSSTAHAYSAKAPRQVPKTSSPGLNPSRTVQSRRPSGDIDARSRGLWSAQPPHQQAGEERRPLRRRQSSGFTEAARILIRTSWSFGVGLSTSESFKTSGEPYSVQVIAFMRRCSCISTSS